MQPRPKETTENSTDAPPQNQEWTEDFIQEQTKNFEATLRAIMEQQQSSSKELLLLSIIIWIQTIKDCKVQFFTKYSYQKSQTRNILVLGTRNIFRELKTYLRVN